jgi:RHS repeat-associated protein
VTDSNGALQAQYDYDAWGNSVVVSGNMNVDFGFTGHYFHQPSGLHLSPTRPYSPPLARWISRDPIAEAGGVNLYAYVGNNSTNAIDPLGLWTAIVVGGATWDNPFGHVAIGVSGSGVYSFGTHDPNNGRPTPLGSSFTDFLNSQATYRSMDVYLINTTPEQEAAILGYLKTLDPQLPEVPGKDSHNDCASRTNDALGAAGLVDPSLAFLPFFFLGATSPFPGSSAMIGEIYSHGFVVHIPRGALYQCGAPFTDVNPR